jgi:hypothetical protein
MLRLMLSYNSCKVLNTKGFLLILDMGEVTYPSVLGSYGKDATQLPPFVWIARQVDDILNSVVGLAPVEPVLNIVRDIMPANVVKTVTGLDKPSEIVNPLIDDIAQKIRSSVSGRRLRL